MKARHFQPLIAAAIAVHVLACKTENTADPAREQELASTSATLASNADPKFPAFGARIYVSAVNCEMNAADAERINALPQRMGISVEVIFTGIAASDTAAAQQARSDLGLTVPTRIMHDNELAMLQHTGTTRLPVALVIKARQLSTIISSEPMPKTLELISAAFSPGRNQ